MSNLLLTASAWTNGLSVWNGSAYEFLSNVTISYAGTVPQGARVAGTLVVTAAGSSPATLFRITDATGVLLSQTMQPGVPIVFDLAVSGSAAIGFGHDPDGTSSPYSIDALLTPSAVEPQLAACEEIGRETRAYVSAHTRARVHSSRLYPNERRCLVANFNGAIPASRTIVTAQWDMEVPLSVAMSSPRITADGRTAELMIDATYRGDACIRCQVTLDNGEVYNQLFHIEVVEGSWFGTEQSVAGPSRLVVTA